MAARNNSPPYQAYLGHGQASPPAPEYEENYYGHPFPRKTTPQPQQLPSPGLESVMADEGDKEVAFRRWSRPDPMPQTWSQREQQQSDRRSRTVCGLSLLYFWILLAVLVAIGVGLGVGLGIGLNSDDRYACSANCATNCSENVTGQHQLRLVPSHQVLRPMHRSTRST